MGKPKDSPEPEDVRDTDEERPEFDQISRWREEQLLAAGYEGYHAFVLSRMHDVDLHQACELLKKGASEDVAMSILL